MEKNSMNVFVLLSLFYVMFIGAYIASPGNYVEEPPPLKCQTKECEKK